MASVRLLLPRFQAVFVAMTPARPAASAHPQSGGAEKKFNEEQTRGRDERDSKQTTNSREIYLDVRGGT